jgi:hypothetical protein
VVCWKAKEFYVRRTGDRIKMRDQSVEMGKKYVVELRWR